jgi:carbamoyltransferase
MEECTSVGRVAKILSQGKVVARCRGRSELGQRALGNRSILGNPSKAGIVSRLNDQIKYRDFWMPFCPTILESDANIFLNYEKKTPAKFMTMGFDVRAEQMETIAGVIHPADGSARPQILAKSDNAEYHELISNFKKLTGVGCLLNTSFNLHGEPVVESSEDAIKTFLGSGLDALWVGDYLIQRNEKKE